MQMEDGIAARALKPAAFPPFVYSDSQITDGMESIIKRENKAGIRQKHKTCLPRTISVVDNDLFGTDSSTGLLAGD